MEKQGGEVEKRKKKERGWEWRDTVFKSWQGGMTSDERMHMEVDEKRLKNYTGLM